MTGQALRWLRAEGSLTMHLRRARAPLTVQVLGQARAQLAAAPAAVLAALAELEAVADELAAHYPALPLYFDLGELRGYHYHTGMVFAAFVPGVGQAIAQGGRYDDIGADFGRARPATGFSTDLKTLVSLGQAIQAEAPGGVWAPQGGEAGLWQAVLELRRSGRRVVQALPGQSLVDARAAGCDSELCLQEGGWQVSPLAS